MTEQEKIEMLLRPRVIVENKWPGCELEVDDILIKDGEWYWKVGDTAWHTKISAADIEPFPYLMRPLQWWEDRKPEEMPEYVKDKFNQIHKVIGIQNRMANLEKSFYTEWEKLTPATQSEYLQYHAQKSKEQ